MHFSPFSYGYVHFFNRFIITLLEVVTQEEALFLNGFYTSFIRKKLPPSSFSTAGRQLHSLNHFIQLCIENVFVKTLECLFHSGKRKCQVHTDCVLHEECLTVLPVNAVLITFLEQLVDCHVVLL